MTTDTAASPADDDWVRGTCPRCGSGEVLHHMIGLPLAGAMESSPPWVHWAGCVGLGPDRACEACDHEWWVGDVGTAEESEDGSPVPLRVVGAVLVDGERVLAARRRPGLREGGRWEFPGGKIELGESPQQALQRELREELGVEVEVGWLIGRGSTARVDLDCYWARLTGPPPTSSTDHDLLAWVPRDELEGRDWPEPDRPVVRMIVEGAAPRFGPA